MGAQELTDYLRDVGVLKTERLYKTLSIVDRKDFVPGYMQNEVYEDHALPIGYNQTISQPYTVAFMLELLQPRPGDNILDIGSGSGWTTALLANVVRPKGSVIGLELVPELVKMGQQNLAKYNFKHAKIHQASQNKLNVPANAKFDRILVSASAEELPDELVSRLSSPGRMVVPVRNSIMVVRKDNRGKTNIEEYPGFVFVPLIM